MTPESRKSCRTAGLEGAGDPLLLQAGSLFKALGDPSRLRLLQVLLEQVAPLTQGELARLAGLSIPNASKHLALLHREGLVSRTSLGNQVRFAPNQPMVGQVCGLVCDFILDRSEAHWRDIH
jgi:DNA-binding transcriptional ArsR family regulator